MKGTRRGSRASVQSVRRGAAQTREKDADKGGGAGVIILQAVVCLLALAFIFTLRYINEERFRTVGAYYRAEMGEESDDEVYVGSFGEPITLDKLGEFFGNIGVRDIDQDIVAGEQSSAAEEISLGESTAGQGGEQPYIPDNVYLGQAVFSARACQPASGFLSSGFGLREHPITGKQDFHTGIDIAAPYGSDILAVFPGRVTEVGFSDTYGSYIRLTHSDGLETVYCHCSVILAGQGALVRAGERIAEVGSSGVSTGPHLHLTLLIDGCYADPMELFA